MHAREWKNGLSSATLHGTLPGLRRDGQGIFINTKGTSMPMKRTTDPVEHLESRLLLSTTLNSRGVLYILGTSKNDSLSAYLATGNPNTIEVRDRGVVSQFARSAVTQVIFQGFSGDDTIVISNVNGILSIQRLLR